MDLALARAVRLLFRLLLAALLLGTTASFADDANTVGLSSLQEEALEQVSQTDPNPLGEKALAIRAGDWKHAETEHFVYHFFHGYVATPVSVEAEFHYRVIVKELESEPPGGETKSHVYVFEKPEDWQQFQTYGNLERWTGGIHSAGSLFIQRNPAYRFSGNELGHEIVHLILHRYYTGGIPRWLDEGMAQYISKGAHASYQRARGYLAKPRSQPIAPEGVIPLSRLVTFTQVPNDHVETFYDESERLVRFLASTDKPAFLQLADALGRHQPFEAAFTRIYAGKFANMTVLEEKFREYVSRDFDSTLQQVSEN